MNRQTLPHGYTTGHHLWLCLALAMGLALSTHSDAARECQRETPLPAAVRLTVPGPEVPEDDVGQWRITPEGQFCRTWCLWENRQEHCYTVSREGETFELAV